MVMTDFLRMTVWTFNSQVSTQWDGLRHFGYQDAQLFYNGVSQSDIHHVDHETGQRSTVLGIHGTHLVPTFLVAFLFFFKLPVSFY